MPRTTPAPLPSRPPAATTPRHEAQHPLRRAVNTGRDNLVRTAPFEILNLTCAPIWDPQAGRLSLSYEIRDPGNAIRRGRVLYETLAVPPLETPDGYVEQRLARLRVASMAPMSLRPMPQTLPNPECWDGVISESDVGDARLGTRVTAELSRIRIRMEVWNHEGEEPDTPPPTAAGQSPIRAYVARARCSTAIDAIQDARWDTSWVIPFDDPEEPEHGWARMLIRVKNVADGTPVAITVYRIAAREQAYDGTQNEVQPGLMDCVVRGGYVIRTGRDAPPNASEHDRAVGNHLRPPRGAPARSHWPWVRFDRHDAHWKDAEPNFYAFSIALGLSDEIPASQRDYRNHEHECVNLRYTVFIHAGSDIPIRVACARRLHRFLRAETRYYRSYLLVGSPSDLDDWLRRASRRFMTLMLGHAGAACRHPEHPHRSMSAGPSDPCGDPHDASLPFLGLYHSGFAPDEYVCPSRLLQDPAMLAHVEAERAHYLNLYPHSPIGVFGDGCGHHERVSHMVLIGAPHTAPRLFLGNDFFCESNQLLRTKGDSDTGTWLQVGASAEPPTDAPISQQALLLPRFLFYSGGCRTILTRNFGRRFTLNGTRYFHGWVYSVDAGVNAGFLLALMARWIRGSAADPAPSEFDPRRFRRLYGEIARMGAVPSQQPRLMEALTIVSPVSPPGEVEEALE